MSEDVGELAPIRALLPSSSKASTSYDRRQGLFHSRSFLELSRSPSFLPVLQRWKSSTEAEQNDIVVRTSLVIMFSAGLCPIIHDENS